MRSPPPARISDAKAVVTIAAPSGSRRHVTGLFADRIDDIREHGGVEVSLAGRPFQTQAVNSSTILQSTI